MHHIKKFYMRAVDFKWLNTSSCALCFLAQWANSEKILSSIWGSRRGGFSFNRHKNLNSLDKGSLKRSISNVMETYSQVSEVRHSNGRWDRHNPIMGSLYLNKALKVHLWLSFCCTEKVQLEQIQFMVSLCCKSVYDTSYGIIGIIFTS